MKPHGRIVQVYCCFSIEVDISIQRKMGTGNLNGGRRKHFEVLRTNLCFLGCRRGLYRSLPLEGGIPAEEAEVSGCPLPPEDITLGRIRVVQGN